MDDRREEGLQQKIGEVRRNCFKKESSRAMRVDDHGDRFLPLEQLGDK